MIFLIYAICLFLGLSLALPFFFSFQSAAGYSAVSKNLDFTTFSELMNFHSWNLESIFHQGIFTVVVYWLLMIFFAGGIIRSFNREDYSVPTFFSGAGVNFLRFLVCDLLMIGAQIVMFVVLFGLASLLLQLFGNTISERPLFWAYTIAAFIYACVVVLLLMISDYAKFYMEMAETHRVFKAIGKAVKYVFNNFVKTYFLYALLLVVPILTLVLYKLTFDKIGTAATWGLIAMFFIQQFFIILRIWYRVWSLSSQFEMFADDYVKVSVFDVDVNSVPKDEDDDDEKNKIEISKKTEIDKIVVTVVEKTETTTQDKEPEPEYDNLIVQNVVADTDTKSAEAEKAEEKEPETKTVTTTTTTTTETIVLNNEGDTFTRVVEEEKTEEKEPEYDNLIVNQENTTNTSEPEKDSETQTVTTTETETVVLNEQGDTFTSVVEENKPEEKEPEYDNLIVNTVNTENKTDISEPEQEKISDSEEKKNEEPEEEPEEQTDEVNEELMEQFYANNDEELSTTDETSETQTVTTTTITTTTVTTETTTETIENQPATEEDTAEIGKEEMRETEEEELPGYNPDEQDDYAETDNSDDNMSDFSIDTAMGANISLEEEEEEIVTTVTEEKDPKIIKLNDAVTASTEVVSESEADGELSFEKHQDGEFSEFLSKDDNEKAMG
jgi:hypothetical protein